MNHRVVVVGAGPSGLTTLKNLAAEGIDDVVAYEMSDQIGGNWVFRPTEGHSSVYETTHMISSKRYSQFEDFPMPADYPDFPSHRQVLEYFRAYAQAFGLEPRIVFDTRLDHAAPEDGGGWRLRLRGPDGERTEHADHLIVCSGHHWDPMIPDLPGEFSGKTMHSHAYKSAEPMRGKRVLVVGGGNSACDIAVESARVAEATRLSLRRGYYIIPKIVFGMPTDVVYARLRRLPKPLRQRAVDLGIRIAMGRWSKYGLEKPACRAMEMHPTLNGDILSALRHGTVQVRPGIERMEGETVRFADGRTETFDTIVWATGYRTSFPFFDPGLIDWRAATRVPLYLKMMPEAPVDLYFVGLFQPLGCIWPLADHQARIAARRISGRLRAPADLAARIAREQRRPHWRFEDRPRHALEVDYHQFRQELMSELERSAA